MAMHAMKLVSMWILLTPMLQVGGKPKEEKREQRGSELRAIPLFTASAYEEMDRTRNRVRPDEQDEDEEEEEKDAWYVLGLPSRSWKSLYARLLGSVVRGSSGKNQRCIRPLPLRLPW